VARAPGRERDGAYTPVSDAAFLAERIPDAELVVIDDAGHLPNAESGASGNSPSA
jgi:pimeloyl-ACP methyl ester carboxylesterase